MADCCEKDALDVVAAVSAVFTAVVGLFLAFYVFIYQRAKDRFSNRLQWFKDLIIEPNKEQIYTFFKTVEHTSEGLHSHELTDLKKSELLSALKSECSSFRRHFIILLSSVDEAMETDIQHQLDALMDRITEAAFDANVNLADEAEFEDLISFEITRAKNYVLGRIFRYEGEPAKGS